MGEAHEGTTPVAACRARVHAIPRGVVAWRYRGGAPPALPVRIDVKVELPGAASGVFAHGSVDMDGLPWNVTGCVLASPVGACEETSRVELDESARAGLVTLLGEVHAIPRCEPDGLWPGDRSYEVHIANGASYSGPLPADEAQLGTRNAGACRADARLAWWIARRLRDG